MGRLWRVQSLMVLLLSCGCRWAENDDKYGKRWNNCTLWGGSRVCPWGTMLSLWVCHGPQDAFYNLFIVVFCCVTLVWTKCARYLLCNLKIPLLCVKILCGLYIIHVRKILNFMMIGKSILPKTMWAGNPNITLFNFQYIRYIQLIFGLKQWKHQDRQFLIPFSPMISFLD